MSSRVRTNRWKGLVSDACSIQTKTIYLPSFMKLRGNSDRDKFRSSSSEIQHCTFGSVLFDYNGTLTGAGYQPLRCTQSHKGLFDVDSSHTWIPAKLNQLDVLDTFPTIKIGK